tara:strand:+ start:444740 stop:445552 length:813 start_codon:yes stop_codon:yes gene_type:complete
MKTTTILFAAIFALILSACTYKKSAETDTLFNTTWELEYISGPRIAFKGLYPDRKPQISFNSVTKKVTGSDSCNGYSADFTIDENALSFGEPGPATLMYCGEGEKHFLNMMKKINAFRFDENEKLNLMMDEVSMMRFKKVENVTPTASIPNKNSSRLEMGCYTYDNDGDFVNMEITALNENIEGNLHIAYAEKDVNKGTFIGVLDGDKLIGTFTFHSEGVESSREIAFLVKDNQLIEGYGALTENGTDFKDVNTIAYTSKMPLSKVACAD